MFSLTIDLESHFHDHSPTAHRATIQHALDLARQKVGDGVSDRGDLIDPNGKKIGRWSIGDGGSHD